MSSNKQVVSEYIIAPPSNFSLNLRELVQYKELFYTFALRDIKVKYKQTVLGFLWAVLQPFLMMMVFVFFFSKTLNIPTGNMPPPIFYYSGLLLWNLFNTGLTSSANSMVTNANIIKKIYFPRIIIPLSGVLVAFFDFLMAGLVFCGILVFYELTDSTFTCDYVELLLYFPLATLLAGVSTFGLGSLLAALNVKYRDFRYIIPFMLQFLLFMTPVIYPVSLFDHLPYVKYLLAMNPLSGAIMLGRAGFTGIDLDPVLLSISMVCASAILILGVYVFKKTEYYFADLA